MSRKEERIRQEAMDYAYHIVETQGKEALKARCTRNAETFIPALAQDSVVQEFIERAKHSCMFTELAVFLYVLHDLFGWDEAELQPVLADFVKKSDLLFYKWFSFNDIAKVILEETGIDLEPYMPLAYKASLEIDKAIESDPDGYQPGFGPDKKE